MATFPLQVVTVSGKGSALNATEFDSNLTKTRDCINDLDGRVNDLSSKLNLNDEMIYGFRWDYVNDVFQPGILLNGAFVATDYNNYPIQDDVKRVLLTSTGEETELHPFNSALYPDGSNAIVNGSAGHIVVRIPLFYMLTYTSGNFHYGLISKRKFTFNGVESWIPLGFNNRSVRYISAFEGTAMSDSLTAQVGSVINSVWHPNGLNTSGYTVNPYPAPFTNRTRGQFRTQCNNGVFKQFSWGDLEILQILFYTKYKTFDSQAVLPGHTWRSAFNYADATKPGATYTLGNQDGYITDTNGNVIANSFLGVENFFGNVWKFVDGININNIVGAYDVYICHNPANFADDTSTNYSLLTGTTDFGDADGYITNFLMNASKLGSFFPTSITGGSSSGFVHDYMWNAAGGWRVLLSGGSLYHSAPAGVATLGAHYSSALVTADFTCRLAGYV